MSKEKNKTDIDKKIKSAKETEYIKTNGSKKNWSKSDYFVDMLSKED